MNYFILTMQYNENLMLPIFLDHYSRFVDPKHIKVIDHGSTNIPSYLNYERVYIPRDRPFSESSRLRVIQHNVAGLLEYYDFGIFVDCDELIDLTDIHKITFEKHRIHHVAGFDVFFRNTETGVRLHGLLNPGMCKPSIFSYIPYWTAGFHDANEQMSTLQLPMAHTRFLYGDHAKKRLSSRAETYVTMPEIERTGGVDVHWLQGTDNVSSFYQHVNTKGIPDVRRFEEIDPTPFIDPEVKKAVYRYSDVEYDLTERFSHLLNYSYVHSL